MEAALPPAPAVPGNVPVVFRGPKCKDYRKYKRHAAKVAAAVLVVPVVRLPKADRADCFLPSLEEIAQACAEIQRGWSAAERRQRTQMLPDGSIFTKPTRWTVPQVKGGAR